jgi:hypothetical protein
LKQGIAFCVTALALAAATPAMAQLDVDMPRRYYPPPPEMTHPGLPPHEILMIVRASGLRPLTQPARQGPLYVLLASDNMGGQLRVSVGAQSGRILHAAPANDPRFAYEPVRPRGLVPVAPPQHAAAPPSAQTAPDLREPTPPLPRAARATPPAQKAPAAGPSQTHGLASAPDAATAAPSRPARTPLPRPRPAIASSEAGAPAPTPPAEPSTPQAASAEASVTSPPAAAPSEAPAQPAPTETQMVPVAPLD